MHVGAFWLGLKARARTVNYFEQGQGNGEGNRRRNEQLGNRGGVWLGAQIANQIAPMIGVSPATITASRIDAPAPATPPSMVNP